MRSQPTMGFVTWPHISMVSVMMMWVVVMDAVAMMLGNRSAAFHRGVAAIMWSEPGLQSDAVS